MNSNINISEITCLKDLQKAKTEAKQKTRALERLMVNEIFYAKKDILSLPTVASLDLMPIAAKGVAMATSAMLKPGEEFRHLPVETLKSKLLKIVTSFVISKIMGYIQTPNT